VALNSAGMSAGSAGHGDGRAAAVSRTSRAVDSQETPLTVAAVAALMTCA